MLKPGIPELKVLEYTQALQRTQNLESRGDLLNKGIYKLLMTVYEWSEKFLSNRSLPTPEHLVRDLGLDEEKIDHFIIEFAIRTNPPLFRKINYVDYIETGTGSPSHAVSHLRHYTVLCRPTSADGGTCYRYVTGLNDVSVDAIKKWIREKRIPLSKDEFRESIFSAIDSNRLYNTYASTEIGNLFQCPYDKIKKLKDVTLAIHIKPILKKLVDEKLVFFLRNEKATKPGNKSVFYYFNKEEIFNRLDIYMDYLKDKIVPDLVRLGVIDEPDEDDYHERKTLVESIQTYMNDSYGDQKSVVEEILLLNDFYNLEMEKVEEEKKKQNLAELIAFLRASGKIMDFHHLKIDGEKPGEEARNYLLNDQNVLYTEYADKYSYYEYVLHKLNLSQAVESAVQFYQSTGNDSEITILRFMGIEDEIDDPSLLAIFEDAESRALFPYLPFFTWLWRWITGNKKVDKSEAEVIRNSLRKGIQNKIAINRTKYIAVEKQRQDREKSSSSSNSNSLKTNKSNGLEPNSQKGLSSARSEILNEGGSAPDGGEFSLGSMDEDDTKTKEDLKQILFFLNEAWDFGYYPDRQYLLEKLENSMTEDELVSFIKKKAGKEIYSYMIRNQIEKYPFPILVTRDYLKKNGSRILDEVEKIIEEQKNQAMPEQLKFDIAVSTAEFLDRVLPKIK